MSECQCQTTTEEQAQTLADVALEVTDNGRIIFEFLADVVQGKLEGATLWYRMEAVRQFRAFGIEIPEVVIEAAEEAAGPRTESDAEAPAASSCPRDELIEFVRNETDNGKDVLRFLLDVVRDRVADAKLYHRIAAAKELRHYLLDDCYHDCDDEEWDDEEWDDEEWDDDDDDEEKILNDEDDPFDLDNYDRKEYQKDRNGKRALRHIFGGNEAERVAYGVAEKHWRKVLSKEPGPDRDMTPIENPEDDPYCKGHYGYKALFVSYGNNDTVRVATKAVAEYYKYKYWHLINEDGSLVTGDETASLDPNTLQYLERSRHLLTNPPKNPDPLPRVTHEPAEQPPAPAQPPSTTTPGQPDGPSVGEGFKPSQDHAHPSTDHNPDRPHVILERSEEPPGPPPEPSEKPPKPRKKTRRIIHLGPPDEEDPPDDNPRRYRDPDEIRIPLRDLVRYTGGPL